MNFRTTFEIEPSLHKINLSSKVLCMGSCFADVLGQHLQDNKIRTLSQPFGTIFNPVSLFNPFQKSAIIQQDDVFLSLHHHSSIWAKSEPDLKQLIEEKQQKLHTFKPDFIILTFGTAWAYRHIESQERVANCHKLPASNFKKELLSVEEIMEGFEAFQKLFPEALIVLTVSPVRHTRDTLPLNAVSKSTLRLACHQITEKHPNTAYFPAYEWLLDDLRDYRFYKNDLIHPSTEAEQYIIERFKKAYFDEVLLDFCQKWQQISSQIKHKPLHEGTQSHRLFLKNTLENLQKIEHLVDVRLEKKEIEKKLK